MLAGVCLDGDWPRRVKLCGLVAFSRLWLRPCTALVWVIRHLMSGLSFRKWWRECGILLKFVSISRRILASLETVSVVSCPGVFGPRLYGLDLPWVRGDPPRFDTKGRQVALCVAVSRLVGLSYSSCSLTLAETAWRSPEWAFRCLDR